MEIYINGLAGISPQSSWGLDSEEGFSREYESRFLLAVEPDYKAFINPIQIRRMSRIMKMGVSAGKMALSQAELEHPDAIIVGTGLGCLEDTEKFLVQMIESNEASSAPTHFISSTHNSVSAQIALLLKCLSYNFTYVHKGLSLVCAVQDAIVKLQIEDQKHILVGAIDEHVDVKFRHYDLLGWWKKSPVVNTRLYESKDSGTISGEGAHFFVLSSIKSKSSYCILKGAHQYHQKANAGEMATEIYKFILACGLMPDDIDLLVSGVSGDVEHDSDYYEIHSKVCPRAGHTGFKHLSGSFYTSDGFALWLSSQILKSGNLPTRFTPLKQPESVVKHVLIYNNSFGADHVMYLLSAL